jgi:hypothetical protein
MRYFTTEAQRAQRGRAATKKNGNISRKARRQVSTNPPLSPFVKGGMKGDFWIALRPSERCESSLLNLNESQSSDQTSFLGSRPGESVCDSLTRLCKRAGRVGRDRARSRRSASYPFAGGCVGKSGRNSAGGQTRRQRQNRSHGGAEKSSRQRSGQKLAPPCDRDGRETRR